MQNYNISVVCATIKTKCSTLSWMKSQSVLSTMCHESWLANVKKNHILLYVTKYALFSILCNAGILFGMLKSAYFGHNGNTLKGLLLNGPSIPVFCGQFYDVPEVCVLHPSLLIYFFPTPPETETSNTWETRY